MDNVQNRDSSTKQVYLNGNTSRFECRGARFGSERRQTILIEVYHGFVRPSGKLRASNLNWIAPFSFHIPTNSLFIINHSFDSI
jgi:hypothetical protein